MLTTFIAQIKTMLHRPAMIFWALAFPIILATMFHAMFQNIESSYSIEAQPIDIVRDDAWDGLTGAQDLVEALQDADTAVLKATQVPDADAALADLREGRAVGYLAARDGELAFVISDSAATTAESDGAVGITLSIISDAVTRYNDTARLGEAVGRYAPEAFLDDSFTGQLGSTAGLSEEIRLTRTAPDEPVRYQFALLGMACLMTMTLAIGAISESQPNLSTLGARRCLAPLPKWRILTAGFLAAWLVSACCMSLSFIVIRYVFSVGVAGREPFAFLGIGVATFMASSLGSLIGALPKLGVGSKVGISTGMTCLLSLFAGLYGQPAMQLGDMIQRELPLLADINPVRQVSQLFHDILYYDSLQPFVRTAALLAVMSIVFLAIAALMLRRQRYEHL